MYKKIQGTNCRPNRNVVELRRDARCALVKRWIDDGRKLVVTQPRALKQPVSSSTGLLKLTNEFEAPAALEGKERGVCNSSGVFRGIYQRARENCQRYRGARTSETCYEGHDSNERLFNEHCSTIDYQLTFPAYLNYEFQRSIFS